MARKKTVPRTTPAATSDTAPNVPKRESLYQKEIRQEQHNTKIDDRERATSALSALLTAAKDPTRILRRRIDAVSTIDIGEKNTEACWVLNSDCPVNLVIPFSEAYDTCPIANMDSLSIGEKLRRQRQLMVKSLGIEVQFCITKLVQESQTIIGSRKVPNELLRKVYFGENATRSLQVGTDVRATILARGPHSLYINVCGVDMSIHKGNLTYRYYPELTQVEEYAPGNSIILRLKGIREDTNGIPTLVLTGRDAELEQANNRKITYPGSGINCVGTVTSISDRDQSKIRTYLWLDNLDMPAVASESVIDDLVTGTKVLFLAFGQTKSGFVHGRIIRKV